jgi:Fe-S-cluster containining protein
MSEAMLELHIPEGINYECTGCGKCCGGWAVPMTDEDYGRIKEVDWAARSPKFSGKNLFRPLKGYEKKGTPYTHAIKEGDDGRCPFLVDNLCFIHSQFQSETKPSICQLFPYCFNETPSGVYATVSFVSMGVVHNSGKALAEQRDYLEKKFKDFQALFPDHHPNWTKLELTGGKPITWDEYLGIEQEIISCLQKHDLPMETRFRQASKYLLSRLRAVAGQTNGAGADNAVGSEAETAIGSATSSKIGAGDSSVGTGAAQLKPLDNHLLMMLHSMYFPTKILAPGEGNFNVLRFIKQIMFKGMSARLRIVLPGQSYTLEELAKVEWCGAEADVEDLLYRYFFSRIFAKLYFGAGFGQLTLITGFHHLALLYALVKLQSRALALSRGVNKVSYIDVVAAVRQLEKRMGETSVDGYAAAALELLMFSPSRVERVLCAV